MLGGLTLFMKTTLTVLLSGLLLCGCSQKQTSSVSPAIDLVQVGKDLVRPDGTVIHVTKRDGLSIEGIQVVKTGASKITITAETGTLQAESDPSKVRLIMYHAKIETTHIGGGVTTMIDEKLSMVF
jgi:hypothetical protein